VADHDPAWDMPVENWVQQGSFLSPRVPPAVHPNAGTLVCLPPIAREWLPLIQGCLDQLRNPSTWKTANDDALAAVLQDADLLRSLFGNFGTCPVPTQIRFQNCVLQSSIDGGVTWTDVTGWSAGFPDCVKQNIPPAPPASKDGLIQQQACNIAGYLATAIIKQSIQLAITQLQTNNDYLIMANDLMAELAGFFPYTAVFVQAIKDTYTIWSQLQIIVLQAAENDVQLWSNVTCAIYTAIKRDGQVTAANYGTIVANICALTYATQSIITGMCTLVGGIGWSNLQMATQSRALEDADCSGCPDTWAYAFFSGTNAGITLDTINSPAWTAQTGGTLQGQVITAAGFNAFTKFWRSVAVGGHGKLEIAQHFPATHIDSVQVAGYADIVAGNSSRGMNVSLGGVIKVGLGFGPNNGYIGQTLAVNQNVDAINITIDSDAVNGATYLYLITVRGKGVCPFGLPNFI
jgi:hypothetical protein